MGTGNRAFWKGQTQRWPSLGSAHLQDHMQWLCPATHSAEAGGCHHVQKWLWPDPRPTLISMKMAPPSPGSPGPDIHQKGLAGPSRLRIKMADSGVSTVPDTLCLFSILQESKEELWEGTLRFQLVFTPRSPGRHRSTVCVCGTLGHRCPPL